MVTALDQPSDKLQGLECGADDFLTKPVDDIALVTRVKSLARLKVLNDEMLMRASTSRQLGLTDEEALEAGFRRARTHSRRRRSSALCAAHHERLAKVHDAVLERDPQAALIMLAEQPFDLLIVSTSLTAPTACACARRCARSTARGTCRSSSLSRPATRRACCAASTWA